MSGIFGVLEKSSRHETSRDFVCDGKVFRFHGAWLASRPLLKCFLGDLVLQLDHDLIEL